MLAVRFCPTLFALNKAPDGAAEQEAAGGAPGPEGAAQQQPQGRPGSPFKLPYRMIFAIATVDSVIIYETEVGWQPLKQRFCFYTVQLALQTHAQHVDDAPLV